MVFGGCDGLPLLLFVGLAVVGLAVDGPFVGLNVTVGIEVGMEVGIEVGLHVGLFGRGEFVGALVDFNFKLRGR